MSLLWSCSQLYGRTIRDECRNLARAMEWSDFSTQHVVDLDTLRIEDGVELSSVDRLPLHPRDGDGNAGQQHQRVAADPHDGAPQVDVGEDPGRRRTARRH